MNIVSDLSTNVMAVIGWFGGAVVVSGLVAKWISDHASQRWLQDHKGQLDKLLETRKSELSNEAERLKLSLKRQELIFNREIEAADALMKLHRDIYPKHSRPDMEWTDACEDIALRLGQVEGSLDDFLANHSAVIGDDVRAKVETALAQAGSEKFFAASTPGEATDDAIKVGEKVLVAITDARDLMIAYIRR